MFAVSSGPYKLSQPALRGMHIRAFVHAAFTMSCPPWIGCSCEGAPPGRIFRAYAGKAWRKPELLPLPALAARAGMR